MAEEYEQASAVPASNTPRFLSMSHQYPNDTDFICAFTLGMNYLPSESDRVLMFKVGWLDINDYHTFDWVPADIHPRNKYIIKFHSELLPESGCTFYELCYITASNEILMKSQPFFFCPVRLTSATGAVSRKNMSNLVDESPNALQNQLHQLQEENSILRGSLKLFVSQQEPKNYDREISELRTLIYSLTDVVNKQRHDLTLIKQQVELCVDRNKELQNRKMEVDGPSYGLAAACSVPRGDTMTDTSTTVSSLTDYDAGELETIPPFPSFAQ